MKRIRLSYLTVKTIIFASTFAFGVNASAQTNVFDDVIATSPNHTLLEAALIQENLDIVLQNSAGTFTVFAPDDNAFQSLATALGTNIAGLLALPNLTDILTYHVLGVTVQSSGITNGQIVQPVSPTNTLKLTLTSTGNVFINQSQVTAPNLNAANGVVHVVNKVLLPYETVADLAIDNGFSTLVTALVTAELLPVVTDPLAALTVFAPTNTAFNDLATALNTNVNGLLALPNLADILTYHVLGTEVLSTAITNGAIVQPVSTTNTLKLTKTGTGNVFINQAQVTLADLASDNGLVHVLNKVLLPAETVVDVAIDNNFTSLTAAVIKAELLPALTDPLAELTVFAPTNAAFADLATALGTDLNGVLANPQLDEILLYHVVSGTVLSTNLVNGPVPTLNGQSVIVDLSMGVEINMSNVTTPDVLADNGVVHIIDAVLLPNLAGISELSATAIDVFPNPSSDFIRVSDLNDAAYEIVSVTGALVQSGMVQNNEITLNGLDKGNYILRLTNTKGSFVARFVKI
jgi:transforming growth factor-beta-induced protein